MSPRSNRTDELGSLFVSVTGADGVTEAQERRPSDRELPAETAVDVEDGLDDAVAGAEIEEGSDPAP